MISMRKELFAGAGELHGIAQRQLHIIMCRRAGEANGMHPAQS
jgi:hypothetical protein